MSSLYEKYNLKQVINTSGRMTALGVSTPRQEVVDVVNYGLNHYFEIKDLVNKTGAYIAGLLNVEDAVIVSCASAGIAQSVAAVIVKNNANLLVNLHSATVNEPREIVLPRGHNVNFGAPVDTMVALGGGKVVEAGYANECSPEQIEACITPQTAAILYVKSHHCVQKSILTVEQAVVVARKHNLPLIVDAAAEEDLMCYYQMGADLVIGKKQYVEWVKQQSGGIGRAMKVGKEGILGLTQAIESYLTSEKTTGAQMVERMTPFISQLNTLNGISAKTVWDSAGRDIARVEITFDEAVLGMSTVDIVQRLKTGDIAIYFRGYKANEGKIEVDVRSVNEQQLMTVFTCIKNLFTENQA